MPVAPISLRWWLLPLVLFAASAPLWLHRFEPATFVYLNTLCAGVAAPVWTGLSLLGNAWGVLGVTAPLLVMAPRLMWAWLCAAPFAIVFARVGKGLIVSPRPAAEVDNAQMRIVGEALHNVSMPSGHTLTAFAVASAIYFALPLKAARGMCGCLRWQPLRACPALPWVHTGRGMWPWVRAWGYWRACWACNCWRAWM